MNPEFSAQEIKEVKKVSPGTDTDNTDTHSPSVAGGPTLHDTPPEAGDKTGLR